MSEWHDSTFDADQSNTPTRAVSLRMSVSDSGSYSGDERCKVRLPL